MSASGKIENLLVTIEIVFLLAKNLQLFKLVGMILGKWPIFALSHTQKKYSKSS